MEFRGTKILECPAQLQQRPDKTPDQESDDLLSDRLTLEKRCKEELRDRVLAE